LIFISSAVFASDFSEPRGDLTLADAIAAALLRNPGLQSATFDIRISDARTAQSKLRPNPELGIALENFGGSLGRTSLLESTLSLSQVIELGDKRRRRTEVASYGRDTIAIEREAKQLDVLADVTRRFIDVAAQQAQLVLMRHSSELSEKNLAAISRRVEAARSPEAEKNRAIISLGRARLEEKQTEQALLSGHRRLAALWGSVEPRFGDAKADLFDLPAVASFEELVGKLKNNPDFLRFASEARLRDAEWQLATAEAKSNVTVGAGLRRFEETGDTGFVVNISMPLSFANSNQGAIHAAALRRDQVVTDRQAAFISTQATLFEFYQALQFARAQVSSLREQLIPQAEAALAQTRYGYERGRFSYLELADAQRELIALQRESIEAAATYHRARAEIERLTNTSLANTSLTATQD
jgi:outer membrane protein, heavy metal efflux system